ncbi:MAG: hypothetical protein GXO71_06510 [Caldiserica bacterium]|nr:hypothetical protein [Caldisericota bacterium]
MNRNRAVGITFMVGALLYFIFTTWVVGHGIHPINTIVAIFLFLLGFIYTFRGEEGTLVKKPAIPSETLDPARAQKLKIYFVSFAFLLLSFIILALFYVSKCF